MKSPNLLLLNTNQDLHPYLEALSNDYETKTIHTPQDVALVGMFSRGQADVVIIDVSQNDGMEGIRYAQEIRQYDQSLPIILIVSHTSEKIALGMVRVKINDYVKLPCSYEEITERIIGCMPPVTNVRSREKAKTLCAQELEDVLLGQSQAMDDIREYIEKVALSDSTVLITGETGTGKEIVARQIHEQSVRRKQAFISVNCAAVPETLLESELFGYDRGAFTGAVGTKPGKMELAQRGTIFFDEIGDMGMLAQAKILRAIEEQIFYRLGGKREVSLDVRVIAATNQNLDQFLEDGKFRRDLYYRLNVARIAIPSLRDRKEDVPLLIQHYIQNFNQLFKRRVEGLTKEAEEFLWNYSWPGNVRELKNLLEATFINLPPKIITLMDLPPQFRAKAKECEALPSKERDEILTALMQTSWRRGKAAKILNWSRMTLYRKMQKYDISKTYKIENENDIRVNGKNVTTRDEMYQDCNKGTVTEISAANNLLTPSLSA